MTSHDMKDIYRSAPPPQNHIATVRDADPPPLPLKEPSYGLDAPMGLLMSNIAAPLYLYASLKGKGDFWDNIVSHLSSDDIEAPVLDVGCGRGLVLLKLALRKKALGRPTAPAYGIDIFNSADQTGNSPTSTYANAACLGLLDHVVLHSADFTKVLPFRDEAFHVVTASLSLHNVSRAERCSAVVEMIRVTSPGGEVIILDLAGYVAGYRDVFTTYGWTDLSFEFCGPSVMFGLWPCQLLKARKPSSH